MTTQRKTYRLLTGPDDAAFCQRVSEALEAGYRLWGNPAITVKEGRPLVAQAVVLPGPWVGEEKQS
ncbi:MAG: DUF1737 domain-containing protein [Rhodospirillales bacterium]